jgi:hypothetical protein
MATPTPYSNIADKFLSKITDYELTLMETPDREAFVNKLLLNAVIKFQKICKVDLIDRDETLKQFNVDLTDSEKKILAKYMLCEWLSPKLYSIQNLENHLSTKDFNQFSPANLLKEIRETHDKALKSANGAKRTYAHKNFDPNKELHK